MKKLMLVCCLVIGATAMSFAQGGGGGRPQMKPEDQAKRLQTALTLSDDQTAKITAIYTAQAAKRDSIVKAPGFDMATGRAAFTPLMEATNAKIKTLLTAGQAAAFDKLPRGGRGGGGQGGGGGMGGGGTPPPPNN